MGICFEHALLVRDLSWRPSKERAEAIHSVLHRWRLAFQDKKPTLFEIDGKRTKKISGKSVVRAGRIPDEFVLDYPGVTGPHLREIMGPFVNETEAWFSGPGIWGGMKLVLGRDFKVFEGSDYGPIGAQVLSDRSKEYRNAKNSRSGTAYGATWTSELPRTTVVIRDPTTGELPKNLPPQVQDFAGVWRSGLWMDFDKVYPEFHSEGFGPGRSYGGLGRIPQRQFVEDLERAFGTPLLEVGLYS